VDDAGNRSKCSGTMPFDSNEPASVIGEENPRRNDPVNCCWGLTKYERRQLWE